ncbi:protein O-mannosyl-transferase family [Riemerella columbipharyngis]|uniref:Dolichyl-phosphate-mannose-protein mannosyltransferase n=1 Tax=Riemerella columbipharyngis TaxID=1071918 RepID=A0A1G6ZCP9_9FLAO|nr:glycosyltransferase family 39 protein [Riemerella columbipharyngis]SDE00419.1 Dolichyl-phosphate-mannose-protein mannosyltransferase [Riemerella columbipharyngis]
MRKNHLVILCLSIIAIVYVFSIAKDPILGDSLAFSVQACKGFDIGTNATNHFLYSNFLALIFKLFPISVNPHYIFTSVSILFSIATLWLIRKFLLLFDISHKNTLLLFFLLGLSFTYWRISIITEVYAFYIFFTVLFLYYVFRYVKTPKNSTFIILSFILGLCFLIHIQSILLIPSYLLLAYKSMKIDYKQTIIGTCLFLVVSSILLIPVALGKHDFMAILNDDNPNYSFLKINIIESCKALLRNIGFLVYNFTIFLYFILIGFRKIQYKKYVLAILIPYFVFIIKHDVSDSYVFQLVPYVFLLVAMGKGVECKFNRLPIAIVLILPLFYFSTYKIIGYTQFGKKINNEKGFKGGVRYLMFPALNGNPPIDVFIKDYQNGKIDKKEEFKTQYNYAIEWKEKNK